MRTYEYAQMKPINVYNQHFMTLYAILKNKFLSNINAQ